MNILQIFSTVKHRHRKNFLKRIIQISHSVFHQKNDALRTEVHRFFHFYIQHILVLLIFNAHN
jgi:hypothetical protein